MAGGRRRALVAAGALLAAAALGAGCGGDDEDADTSTSADVPTRTVTVPVETEPEKTAPQAKTTAPSETGKEPEPSSPEEGPGGAGDEEPARSEVVLTGRGGRIGPLLAKVPPFISIRVVLRSGDGKPYLIRFRSRILKTGLKRGGRSSATFAGLRPGRRLVGAALSGRVVIEASAEPGP